MTATTDGRTRFLYYFLVSCILINLPSALATPFNSLSSSSYQVNTSAITLEFMQCVCGEKTITLRRKASSRIIFSPNFPRPYCPGVQCIWRIETPLDDQLIVFVSRNVDMRHGRDFIHFYDGDDNVPPIHNCTGGQSDCVFNSTGSRLIIQFAAGNEVLDRYGFQGIISLSDKPIVEERGSASSVIWIVLLILLLLILIVILAVMVVKAFQRRQQNKGTPEDVEGAESSKVRQKISVESSHDDSSRLLKNGGGGNS